MKKSILLIIGILFILTSCNNNDKNHTVIITQSNATEKLQSEIVLLDFWAEWCIPCRITNPMIEEIARQNKNKILVGKVNIDEEPELSRQFNVSSIPTFIILKNGKETKRFVGNTPQASIIEELYRD